MSCTQHFRENVSKENVRHVLGISGGKDSAALAIYLKDNYPDISEKMEYFFSDTGAELPEIYSFLDKMEGYLGKKINRLNSEKSFEDWLKQHNDYLPSARQRWCTRMMKLKPFEAFVGDDPVISYIGIRADENREGYISHKETIEAVFPYIEDGLVREDIFKILEDSVGIPEYYKWRSRSGCYFCFFQRKDEWLGLKRNHPDLFEKAKEFEGRAREKYIFGEGLKSFGNGQYTWRKEGTLDDVVQQVEASESKNNKIKKSKIDWKEELLHNDDDDPEDQACLICSL
jgi:3'-phosphoadenosine 5'-phosphosulfate sulfotransferase (PAPS reductase)/FAD synthetase